MVVSLGCSVGALVVSDLSGGKVDMANLRLRLPKNWDSSDPIDAKNALVDAFGGYEEIDMVTAIKAMKTDSGSVSYSAVRYLIDCYPQLFSLRGDPWALRVVLK